jgi:hypothetical protein
MSKLTPAWLCGRVFAMPGSIDTSTLQTPTFTVVSFTRHGEVICHEHHSRSRQYLPLAVLCRGIQQGRIVEVPVSPVVLDRTATGRRDWVLTRR